MFYIDSYQLLICTGEPSTSGREKAEDREAVFAQAQIFADHATKEIQRRMGHSNPLNASENVEALHYCIEQANCYLPKGFYQTSQLAAGKIVTERATTLVRNERQQHAISSNTSHNTSHSPDTNQRNQSPSKSSSAGTSSSQDKQKGQNHLVSCSTKGRKKRKR